MPTLSKTWKIDANYSYPDVSSALLIAKSFIWCLKSMLCGDISGTTGTNGAPSAGSRWTVVSSSNSVTASAADNWGTPGTFDATKIVRAAAGVAHSWMLLQSPSALGPTYLLIDFGTASDSTMNLLWSRTAFTGGTITARPTSVAEQGHTGFTIPDLTVAGSHRISRVTDADGMFHVLCARGGQGLFNTWFGFTRLSETVTGDLYTECSMLDVSAVTGRGAGQYSNSILTNHTATQGCCMRSYNNAYAEDQGSSNGFMIIATGQAARTLVNPANSKADFFPMYKHGSWNSVALAAIRGRWPDLYETNCAKNVGDVTPTGTSQWILVGNMLIPNDGVALSI